MQEDVTSLNLNLWPWREFWMKNLLTAFFAALLFSTSALSQNIAIPAISDSLPANSSTTIVSHIAPMGGADFISVADVGFMQSGTEAVARNIQGDPNAQREPQGVVSANDYGAVGDGVTDNASAVALADAAARTANKILVFPEGTYNFSSAVTPSTGATWDCKSYQRTKLRTTSATADLINASNSYFSLRNCQLGASVPRTGGAFIRLGGTNYALDHIFSSGAFNTLIAGAATVNLRINDLQSLNAVAGPGVDFVIEGCLNCLWSQVTAANSATARPFAHLNLRNITDIHCYDCNFMQASHDILINPGNGQSVSSFKMIGGYADTAGVASVSIVPSGTGSVNKILFVGAWFQIASGGLTNLNIAPSGASVVDFIQCLGCEFYAASNIGSTAVAASQSPGTTVKNIQILGGVAGGHGTGFNFAGVTSFQLADALCGNHYRPAPTTCISLSGNIALASVHDVHNSGSANPLANTATITTGNIHDNY